MLKKIALVFVLFFTSLLFGQTATFPVSGKVSVTNAEFKTSDVLEAKITIYRDSIMHGEAIVNPKTGFIVQMEYGHVYGLLFTSPGCYDMFMVFDTKTSADKKITRGNDLGTIPFFSKKITPKVIEFMKWITSTPFEVFRFNGKDGFESKGYNVSWRQKEPVTVYKNYINNIQNRPIPVAVKEARSYDISGKILVGNQPQMALTTTNVKLLNEKGETVDTYKTNRFGKFFFKKIKDNKDYVIAVDDDLIGSANTPANLINKFDKPVDQTQSDAKTGHFKFKLLAGDTNKLKMLSVEDDNIVISGNLLALINGKANPLSKKKVNLVINNNEVIETTETNEFGTFVFTKLPHDQNFMIKLAEDDPSLAGKRILITDRNGKTVNSTEADAKGGFKFEFLEPEKSYIPMMEVDDSQLKRDLKGKILNGDNNNTPLGNVAFSLVTEDNKTVNSSTTDNNGNFTFNYVEKAPLYLLSGKTKQAVKKIIVSDANGVVVKEFKNEKSVEVIRIPLLPVDQTRLSTAYVDDPWLKIIHKNPEIKVGYVIPEKVYFEVNDFKITAEGQNILDKVILVMKGSATIKIEVSAHTDAQGSDQANMELSQKRAKSAVDYMISQGIDKMRLSGVGYGETKLVNRCKNNINCSEDEHTQNRRLEFKIISQ